MIKSGLTLLTCLLGASLLTANALPPDTGESPPDKVAMANPDVVVIAENTAAETPDGERVALAPGDYRVAAADAGALQLTPVAGGAPILIAAEPFKPDAETPLGAWIVAHDGKPYIQWMGNDGSVRRAALLVFEVGTRSIYVPVKPDLRIAIAGPSLHESPVADTWTVTVFSDNAAASNVRFEFNLCTTAAPYGSDCWMLRSVTGGNCERLTTSNPRATGDAWRYKYDLRCNIPSIAANRSVAVRLGMAFGGVNLVNGWGSAWAFHPRVDPQRAISERNEYNNGAWTSFTMHRKTDLSARLNQRCLVRDRNTTISFDIDDLGSRTVSGVRAVLATPGFNIGLAQPASTSTGFSCTFSNDPARVTCINGRTGGTLGGTEINVSLRPKPFYPDGLTPVILQIDPDNRISESSETNNMITKNFEIKRACY